MEVEVPWSVARRKSHGMRIIRGPNSRTIVERPNEDPFEPRVDGSTNRPVGCPLSFRVSPVGPLRANFPAGRSLPPVPSVPASVLMSVGFAKASVG